MPSPQSFQRREFLKASATFSGVAMLPGCSATMASTSTTSGIPTCLPPVKASLHRVIRSVAGLRPYRAAGYVVRGEQVNDKKIVHNYGHGGGGISLCWGSSREAIALGLPGHSGNIAILGAGALGLTTARLLQESGYNISVYAKELPPNTTSNISGGQIHPASYYERDAVTDDWLLRAQAAAEYTRRRMQIIVGDDYGVRWLPTYVESSQDELRPPDPEYPDRQPLSRDEHPFPSENLVQYQTMYVETGRFLASLMRDIRIAGGKINVRDFRDVRQLSELPESLIFNCTGLGARELFGDEELYPVRGQLAILIPQPEIQYAFTGRAGYMFPRPDGIILGGTFERNEWLSEPQPKDIAGIVKSHADFYARWRCG